MILVLAGAGASKAVSPANYPTTIEFFDNLPDDITQAVLFKLLLEFLRPKAEEAVAIDIEQVLWALGEWQEFAKTGTHAGDFPGWLLSSNKLPQLDNVRFQTHQVLNTLKRVGHQADQLASKINERVYTLYKRQPNEAELRESWLPFLELALSTRSRVDVFTTNYDLVLEQAIQSGSLSIETGRIQEVTTSLQVDLWDTANPAIADQERGLLTKLHGSIDWIRGTEEEIYVGTPQFTGQHQRHVIIYPGFKGAPQEPPFTYFHDYSRMVSQRAAAAVFIGFAFRDEYINSIIREQFRPEMPVVVIGLGEQPESMPFRNGKYRYIGEGFSKETATESLSWIKEGLG